MLNAMTDSASHCYHERVTCLNQHELVRKYRCASCNGIMMCACDEAFGHKFLPHQLREGREFETQERVPVTLGFQPRICSECRGLPADPAPAAAIYGRTSKIKRYYWRELFFAKQWATAEWEEGHPVTTHEERRAAASQIEKRVLADIKALHATSPKYVFTERSQAEVIERYGVEVETLSASYTPGGGKGAVLLLDGEPSSPEAFATRYYEALGWSVLPLESVPFHALFGTLMWILIQDGADPKVRMVMFGDRHVYETTRGHAEIWTFLPSDFGSKAYRQRRAPAISAHLDELPRDTDELLWTFDYWRSHSHDFRQYLWAHRDGDMNRARRLIEILPSETILKILRYLVDHYWEHYLGWPDLLLFRDAEILFVEVKSSSDKLSEDQKRWIADNHGHLGLPLRIAKIHRRSS